MGLRAAVLRKIALYWGLGVITHTAAASPLAESLSSSEKALDYGVCAHVQSCLNSIGKAHFNIAVRSYAEALRHDLEGEQANLLLEKTETHLIQYISHALRKEHIDFEYLRQRLAGYNEFDFACGMRYGEQALFQSMTVIAGGMIGAAIFRSVECFRNPIYMVALAYALAKTWLAEIEVDHPKCQNKSQSELQELRNILALAQIWEGSSAPDVILATAILQTMRSPEGQTGLERLHGRLFYLLLKIEAVLLEDGEEHLIQTLISLNLNKTPT